MHLGRTFLATACAVAASLAVLVSDHGAARASDPEVWRVTQVDGEAWLRNKGPAARPVHKGDRLVAGGFVITGDGGIVVLSRDSVAMTVLPHSRTEIPATADPLGPSTVVHRSGSLLVQIDPPLEQSNEPSEAPVLRIETPYLTASVLGTLLSVQVGEEGASLYVATGTVEVRSIASGEVALIRAGQSANVSRDDGGRLRIVGAL